MLEEEEVAVEGMEVVMVVVVEIVVYLRNLEMAGIFLRGGASLVIAVQWWCVVKCLKRPHIAPMATVVMSVAVASSCDNSIRNITFQSRLDMGHISASAC